APPRSAPDRRASAGTPPNRRAAARRRAADRRRWADRRAAPAARAAKTRAVTRSTARTVANLVLVTAGVAAAYVIVTSPPLRRLAATGLRFWLGASVPAYLLAETRRAWADSDRGARLGSGHAA